MKFLILLLAVGIIQSLANAFIIDTRQKRSIDLSASHALIPDARLSKDVIPTSYVVNIRPNLDDGTFMGDIKMNLSWNDETKKISLHAHFDLEINEKDIKIRKLKRKSNDNQNESDDKEEYIGIQRADRVVKKTVYVIHLTEPIPQGSECELELKFSGKIWETTEGLFQGSYMDLKGDKHQYYATYMRPHNARRLFPCFDEPGFKVPFNVSISRPKSFVTLFNTPVERSVELNDEKLKNYVVDYFVPTPPMSTFTFGFLISQLQEVPVTSAKAAGESKKPAIKIWARPDVHEEMSEMFEKVEQVYNTLEKYFDAQVPLTKIDVVAVPGMSVVRPADNWGLILFKESELLKKGYYGLSQELIYQWLGSWVTPYWWSDAHVNKALASFLASYNVIEIDNGVEFNGKYPMTVLYSLYYEFSKRYPHSRITAMKQETTSFKTELVMRMLNYTLGSETFKTGLRKFIANRHFSTFFGDDLWDALTKQAHEDHKLANKYTINEIAGSWITKDRLPVVNVQRNYADKTAKVTQKVYLRERPHDVPEQDKMLWWIPLVIVEQDKLNFTNSTPKLWMEKVREITINNLPEAEKFVIVNPEEIGPFPVNYDEKNWNLLAQYLQTNEGRTKIPIYTRAKLLHDAWNLAYAGDLSFATAFNMTLFMLSERDHLAWNPVFTFIDHIGRHIDMSAVHKKFETYVRILLTPLYEELGVQQEGEETWKTDLRALAKTFLCRAGYRPCIEEAQTAYRKWMESENPDEGNPVPNQYICPVFKWGTQKEWEFGLQRVINFPASRIQSERTYLLKTLAGCPVQPEKIERLLNLTILEENGNFTENDIVLIFSMLTGGSSGYTTLFNFLQNNWDVIRERFENKTNLWDNLISAATGVFTTQEGYDMVSNLYVQKQGEFGSAEHIIEKSLRNIKEETKWSDENLPIIEKWLDNFLKTMNKDENKFMG
ncbi:aminopeptidase N [Condylostylus longicornis]|uniref:aminopeptidase N n=1 Tax=Condylostylus longicornis TaxID=2530218 RepID=UPI00244DDE8C|nr:aminopeptidase N [Condylostylus longicornis]